MPSYLGRRIMNALEPTIKKGSAVGVYDGESYSAIERAVDRYVRDGAVVVLTADSMELYDDPGVPEFVTELNIALHTILGAIDTATDGAQIAA